MDNLIIFGAKYLFIAVILLWVTALLQASRSHRKQIISATIIAGIIAILMDKITSGLYFHPRPFVSKHIQPLISHAADNGFPSEHTLFSMAIAATLVFFRPKLGIAALVIALTVGIARVAGDVHSPIDIAGGAIIGAIAGYIGYLTATKWLSGRKG